MTFKETCWNFTSDIEKLKFGKSPWPKNKKFVSIEFFFVTVFTLLHDNKNKTLLLMYVLVN